MIKGNIYNSIIPAPHRHSDLSLLSMFQASKAVAPPTHIRGLRRLRRGRIWRFLTYSILHFFFDENAEAVGRRKSAVATCKAAVAKR